MDYGAIAAAAAGVVKGGYDIFNQDRINNLNWDRNMELQRMTWAREDNAVQRRVADLKAAGLSPVLAAGSAANTSQPIASSAQSHDWTGGNPILEALGAIQQKADISKTNADTDLTKFMQSTEKWKQDLMSAQVNKTMAETLNLNKQNDIFDLDYMSKINLRNKQAENYIRNSELLKAQTVYKQTELDSLKTNIDILKIQRDIQNMNRSMFTFDKINQYAPSGMLGNIFKTANSLTGGVQSMLNSLHINGFSGYKDNWYWDKK